jgi:hypothetical protein
MKPAIARLLCIIASLPVWIGIVVGLGMPFIAAMFAVGTDTPYVSYLAIFAGILLAWTICNLIVQGSVAAMQFVFLGSTSRAELLIESKFDRPEFQDAIARGEYTNALMIAEVEADLKRRRKATLQWSWGLTWVLCLLGLGAMYLYLIAQ